MTKSPLRCRKITSSVMGINSLLSQFEHEVLLNFPHTPVFQSLEQAGEYPDLPSLPDQRIAKTSSRPLNRLRNKATFAIG